MSADGSSHQPEPRFESLQFDVAESNASGAQATALTCTRCSAPIAGEYYDVNRAIICASCCNTLANPPGSKLRRVSAALGLGILAALGGSILYFAVAAITGREFGLVAIVVGFMVGKAVHRGSGGHGGWAYQTLAVSLTYLAIVATYVPLIAKEFQDMPARSAHQRAVSPSPDTLAVPNDPAITSDSGFPVAQAGTPDGPRSFSSAAPRLGVGTALLGIGALVLLAAIVPIAAGFSNIIGLLIIGIAVFEAWKLNRRVSLRITGPYRVGGSDGTRAVA